MNTEALLHRALTVLGYYATHCPDPADAEPGQPSAQPAKDALAEINAAMKAALGARIDAQPVFRNGYWVSPERAAEIDAAASAAKDPVFRNGYWLSPERAASEDAAQAGLHAPAGALKTALLAVLAVFALSGPALAAEATTAAQKALKAVQTVEAAAGSAITKADQAADAVDAASDVDGIWPPGCKPVTKIPTVSEVGLDAYRQWRKGPEGRCWTLAQQRLMKKTLEIEAAKNKAGALPEAASQAVKAVQ